MTAITVTNAALKAQAIKSAAWLASHEHGEWVIEEWAILSALRALCIGPRSQHDEYLMNKIARAYLCAGHGQIDTKRRAYALLRIAAEDTNHDHKI